MNLKKVMIISLFIVLMCSISAISAISEDAISDTVSEIDSNDNIAVNIDEQTITADDNTAIAAPEEQNEDNGPTPLTQTQTAVKKEENTQTPYEKFINDLENGEKTVSLTGDIKIKESIVIKNSATIDGQGHSIDGQNKYMIFKVIKSTLTIKNTVLKNGVAERGGAIYCYNGNLNIDKCTFTNNKATINGGAIYIASGKLTIQNSRFEKNKAENSKDNGHGGAIRINGGSSHISNTIFKSNYCTSKALKKHSQATKYKFGGGAIYYNEGSQHVLTGCEFTGNQASNDGGAVYAYKPKSLKISKCTFKNNKVSFEDGGAIVFNGKKLVMSDSKFYNNKAYEDGGVMDSFSLTKQKVHITINNCLFKGNTAYKGGGVLWIGLKTVYNMNNNKFINNKATIGGSIYSEDGNVKITKCTFQSNKAKKVTSWTMKSKAGDVLKFCGGAIMIQKKTMKISKSTFTKNQAGYGGSIYYLAGNLKLTKNTFKSNKAKGAGSEICAIKKLKISNNNKWGKSNSKKAVKSKKMFHNVVA